MYIYSGRNIPWILEPFFISQHIEYIYIYTFRIHFFPVRILHRKRGDKTHVLSPSMPRNVCFTAISLVFALADFRVAVHGGKSVALISTWGKSGTV